MYSITLNGHTAHHPEYRTAKAAWKRIAQACEEGRSITAQFWRHTQFAWDENFYQGLIDPDTGQVDPIHTVVIPGVAIIRRQCIAALIYP